MTTKEGSNLCIKVAGYGIKESVVEMIQDDARQELLEKIKFLEQQIEESQINNYLRDRI
jgi:RNA-binding protein YhbY